MDLTAIAAFTAAGLSAVNVLISYRLTSRTHREQWRRDQERPIVARILTVSSDILTAWDEVAKVEQIWARGGERVPPPDAQPTLDRYAAAVEQWNTLRYEAAQLELLASSGAREAVNALISAHDRLRLRLEPDRPGVSLVPWAYDEDSAEALDDLTLSINGLHQRLVEQTRSDLGL